jgi:hypothetical protein
MAYFTNIGPVKGPYLDRDATAAIGVLGALDKPFPIGMALPIGPNDARVALWRLIVRGVELPGLFVVLDRQFWPAGSE